MSHQNNRPKQQQQNGWRNESPDPEVMPKTARRQFSVGYRKQILEAVDECKKAGEIGALLRREGLYSSYLTTWRKQRERGELDAKTSKKRGAKKDPQAVEIARLEKENEKLRKRLEEAEMVIDVQKKLSKLLGLGALEDRK